MKRNSWITILLVVLLTGILALTSACGSKKDKEAEGQKDATAVSASAQNQGKASSAAAEAAAPEAEKAASEVSVSAGTAEVPAADAAGTPSDAQGTQEPAAEAQASGAAQGSLPKVTEQPTDESLTEGYSCMYIASAENADRMMWHAVSPDGKEDIPFSEIGERFPYMDVSGESSEVLSLFNVAAAFNGWGSYCRFENSAGSTDSNVAVTHVKRIEEEKPKTTAQQSTASEGEEAETTETE